MADKRSAGGGAGGGANKKRKYHTTTGKNSNAAVPHNIRGFFVSCENGKEGRTANEMIGVLNEAYEELCPKPKVEKAEGGAGDIQAELAAEVKELKENKNAHFQKLDHDQSKGMMFIKMLKSEEGPTPTALAHHIMNKIQTTRERKSRFCMRFMPVEQTCFASKDELAEKVAPLIAKHFPAGDDVTPVKFSVLYECRASGPFDRSEMIDVVAKQVPKPHSVDLTNPDKTILVSFNKGTCMLGVLDKYVALCKYNIQTLAMTDDERAAMLKDSQARAEAGKAANAEVLKPAPVEAKPAEAGAEVKPAEAGVEAKPAEAGAEVKPAGAGVEAKVEPATEPAAEPTAEEPAVEAK